MASLDRLAKARISPVYAALRAIVFEACGDRSSVG